jgi:AraC-like DNA-binding protein
MISPRPCSLVHTRSIVVPTTRVDGIGRGTAVVRTAMASCCGTSSAVPGTFGLLKPGIVFGRVTASCFAWNSDTWRATNPRTPLVVYGVYFGSAEAERENPLAVMPRYRHMHESDFFEHVMKRCVESWRAGRGAAAQHWLRTALVEMTFQDGHSAISPRETELHDRIDALCSVIRKDPGRHYSLDEFSSRVYCSPNHLIRHFRKYRGITPGEYIIRCRIEAAKNMLLYSEYSISRIGSLLGYCDPYHFSRQFRRKTGVAPSRYRTCFQEGQHTFGDRPYASQDLGVWSRVARGGLREEHHTVLRSPRQSPDAPQHPAPALTAYAHVDRCSPGRPIKFEPSALLQCTVASADHYRTSHHERTWYQVY